MNYPYSGVNRLNDPCNYMYTAYSGKAFLEEYRDSRKIAIELIEKIHLGECGKSTEILQEMHILTMHLNVFCKSSIFHKHEHLKKLRKEIESKQSKNQDGFLEKFEKKLQYFDTSTNIDTLELLTSVLACQLNANSANKVAEWLPKLIQRFEVSKKLYTNYLPGFRKGDGSTQNLVLYRYFSLAMTAAYLKSKNLSQLNALLKVNDLLISLGKEGILNEASRVHTLALLECELAFVTALETESKKC